MEDEIRKILCFEDGKRICAVDFQDVAEICMNVKLRFIPALPDYFCGVFYYGGGVVPVVQIGGGEIKEQSAVLVVRYAKGLFGILLRGTPWTLSVLPEDQTRGDCGELMEGLWAVKGIYQKEKKIILLLDVEKSAKSLTACPN